MDIIRRSNLLRFLSFILNAFFLFYILNSCLRRRKPDINKLPFNFGRTCAGLERLGTREKSQRSCEEPLYKITQRGPYFVLNNYVQSSKKFRCNESVTYVTHGDYYFLQNLIPLTDRWDGPVSVAVHAPGADFIRALASIIYLRNCASRKLRQLVTFHMYFRDGSFPTEIPSPGEVEAAVVDCNLPPPYANVPSNAFPYPVNVGRNVARENALTRYLLVSDIELFPSLGLVEKFLKLTNGMVPGEKAARPRVYPLPVFEIESGTDIPRNKTQLMELLGSGKAQIFHKTICSRCHRIPNFKKWVETKEENELRVLHVAKRMGDFAEWEPIYIGTNEEPFYDERLVWEGKRDKMMQDYSGMARYFGEKDIDEFRECFYLFARSGQINTLDELTVVMRSLGMSPTIKELNKYLKDKGGKMTFADFLDVMHLHSQAEKLPNEVIDAFKAGDLQKKGTIPARHLRHMLLHWGEKLSQKEVDQIFREANINLNGLVRYEDFVKIACAPVPDYY